MYSEVFPSRLRNARESNGLSQVEVAKELKIDQSTLANYELGKREPDIEKLACFAVYYEVSLDWLLGVSLHKKGYEEKEKISLENKERDTILKDVERIAKKEAKTEQSLKKAK